MLGEVEVSNTDASTAKLLVVYIVFCDSTVLALNDEFLRTRPTNVQAITVGTEDHVRPMHRQPQFFGRVDVVGYKHEVPIPVRRAEETRIRPSLSARELAVVRAVCEGLSNKQIAAELQLSESGVKGALQQLFAKTGVRIRSQLVRLALEHHSDDWLDNEGEVKP